MKNLYTLERLLIKFGDLRIKSKAANIIIDRREWVATKDNTKWVTLSTPSVVKLELSINRSKFTITWEHHVQLLNALGTAMEWFYDTNKKDLFVKSEDGQLFFNNDYNNLKVSAYSGKKTHNFLEIRPVVVERDNFKKYEGVIIMLNDTDDYVCITLEELVSLTHILSSFDYTQELMLFMRMASEDKQLRVVNEGTFDRAPMELSPSSPFTYK